MSEIVEYRVGLGARGAHLFELQATFPARGQGHLVLRLPVWTPGSYLVREYQRHLQDLECTDEAGRSLPVVKTGKAAWRVDSRGGRLVRARYRVYAHEVTVRTSHLDDSHAYWNGANLFLYVDELRAAPVRVAVDDLPAGWRITTALAVDRERPTLLHAPDHDTLVDSPVEVGTHELLEFSAAGRPLQLAIWGRTEGAGPAGDVRARLVDDLRAIIETQAGLMGGLPCERYAFLLHLVPGGYGGLEHRSSASVLASPFAFSDDKKYSDLLELFSHEFFHLWNGKRIRPATLGPFDYQAECHTRSLWVVEGWTSYYDRYFLRRAGRIDAARFRDKLGEDLTKLLRIPGRFHQSLEESSWDAWIKLYRPDENTVNSTVSYYLKGSIVALLLDLEIRRRSAGAHRLDDALLSLWRRFQADGAGYADEALQGIVEEAVGLDLDDFFAAAVRGRKELDLAGALGGVGLTLRRSAGEGEEQAGGYLGASTRQDGPRLRVTEALEGSPAQRGGLQAGDELVAFQGWRVDDASLGDRLRASRPGQRVRLAVFRRDELRELELELGVRPRDQVEVVPIAGASDEQKRAYADWMAEAWKE